jgi:hypothetical protein
MTKTNLVYDKIRNCWMWLYPIFISCKRIWWGDICVFKHDVLLSLCTNKFLSPLIAKAKGNRDYWFLWYSLVSPSLWLTSVLLTVFGNNSYIYLFFFCVKLNDEKLQIRYEFHSSWLKISTHILSSMIKNYLVKFIP